MNKIDNKVNIFFIAIGIVLFSLIFFYYVKIIVYPYQGEYREGTALYITHLLLNYKNPFTIEALPIAHTLYGVMYNFASLPFISLFKMTHSLLLSHRLTAALFLLLSIGIIFKMNRSNGCRLSVNIALVSLFFSACFVNGAIFSTVLAQPASLGIFLMLLSVYFPLQYNFKPWAMFASIVASVFCFFTKQYFLVGFILISGYTFLFVSKSKAFLYGSIFLASLLFSCAIVEHVFPLYFAETFYLALTHYSDPHTGTSYFWPTTQVTSQLILFVKWFSPLLIAMLLVGWRNKKAFSTIHSDKNNFQLAQLFNLKLNQPFIGFKGDFYLFSIAITLIIFYLELGKNVGAWMEYLIQLTLPFIILYVGKFEFQLSRFKHIAINVLILLNVFYLTYELHEVKLRHGLDKWQQIEKIISLHNNILATPAVTSILLSQNKKVYLTGQTDYAFYIPNEFNDQKTRFLVPDFVEQDLPKQLDQYQAKILDNIKKKKFDLVILDDQDMLFFEKAIKELKKNYTLSESFELTMPIASQHWGVLVYLPSKK